MNILSRNALPFKDVVVIADIFNCESDLPTSQRRDLEKTEKSTLNALLAAINKLGFNFHHYKEPYELAVNAAHHEDDLVLSIYGGETSRNRMALVPSVCEVFGLKYIGPDTYGRILCQDKIMSKQLAERVGFRVPFHVILDSELDLHYLNTINTTCILKPIAEGSSIGLEQQCVIRPGFDGSSIARTLIRNFGPIIAEEFIPGKEVSYNYIRGKNRKHIAFSEIVVDGQPNFFDTRIFDAHEKLFRTVPRHVANIDYLTTKQDYSLICQIVDAVGTISYCRVDGKYFKGQFFFLEITPDAWIDPLGAFAGSFMKKGWSYERVISEILNSPIQQPCATRKTMRKVVENVSCKQNSEG